MAAVFQLGDGAGYALSHYPIATLTAESAELVRSLGMVALITFVWISALLGITAYLILARLHDQIARERSKSAADAVRQTQSLIRTRDAVIFGLAKLAESRDPDTGDHLERISVYSTMLATALRRHPNYRDEVTPTFVQLIGISSVLHDIGKVGIEDRILLKRGPFVPKERTEMQTHTTIAGECLRGIEQRLGGSNFLQMARQIALCHHENWDGTGYPKGLSGKEIPLSARIVAVADIYDALSSKRVYKDAIPHEECVATIRDEAGKKLDPDLVDVWLTLESRFHSIAVKYGDDAQDASHGEFITPGPAEAADDFCLASSGASSEHSQ
jgi:putative two-component system response regulator